MTTQSGTAGMQPIGGGKGAKGSRVAPPTVQPIPKAPGRLGFMMRFVSNPLLTLPRSVYEEDFVRYTDGPRAMVWITEPSLIKTVLLEEREKFQKLAQIRLLSPLLGKGILTSEGAEWRWQRQATAPMFRRQELLPFVPTFVDATEQMLTRWRQVPAGTTQPIEKEMTRVTFDVISTTLLPSGEGGVAEAIERNTGRFQTSGAWSQLFAIANLPGWLPRPGRRAMMNSTIALRQAVYGLIAEHRASATKRDDLMGRLMAARHAETGEPMNDDQLVDNLLTFYLAGHDTTAKALTWSLYMMAREPEWAEACRAEIETATGGGPITASTVDKLQLVNQVVNESMRLYPPVPMMSRQAVTETQLGGNRIGPGTSVIMPIYAIHRHRRLWERPDEFDPTRFAPEIEGKISRYQFMPFGAGPRICIGMAFAQIEAAVILSTILRAVRIKVPRGYEPVPIARVTLMAKGGLPLEVSMI